MDPTLCSKLRWKRHSAKATNRIFIRVIIIKWCKGEDKTWFQIRWDVWSEQIKLSFQQDTKYPQHFNERNSNI